MGGMQFQLSPNNFTKYICSFQESALPNMISQNSRNIQRDFKPELLNVINPWIKEGRINFEYFYLEIKVIIFLVD